MNPLLSRYFFYYPVTMLKGESVLTYLKSYKQNQSLGPSEIHIMQLGFLGKILKYAFNNCPYYNKLYKNHENLIRNIQSINALRELPTITKQDIIHHHKLISSNLSPICVSHKTTGGSSGHPVTIHKNVNALARERAATWRGYSWAGIDVGDPQARFWGTPLTRTNRIKNKLIDIIANRIRLSAFDISYSAMNTYYAKILKFQPAYLYGYVSMINTFCQHLHDEKLKLPNSVKAIITTSEILTDAIRNQIENNTNLKVFNEYGCGEVGSIAHECPNGSMHIMADNLIVEIDSNDEIIVTDLHNYAMPLIRYRLNDFARFATSSCKCGCQFPILEKIYGRSYDLIQLANGKRAHPEIIMYIFEEFKDHSEGLVQFQFIQHTIVNYSINLVVNDKYNREYAEKKLTRRFNQVLEGTYSLNFKYLDKIKRENSGKIRLVQSEISKG